MLQPDPVAAPLPSAASVWGVTPVRYHVTKTVTSSSGGLTSAPPTLQESDLLGGALALSIKHRGRRQIPFGHLALVFLRPPWGSLDTPCPVCLTKPLKTARVKESKGFVEVTES